MFFKRMFVGDVLLEDILWETFCGGDVFWAEVLCKVVSREWTFCERAFFELMFCEWAFCERWTALLSPLLPITSAVPRPTYFCSLFYIMYFIGESAERDPWQFCKFWMIKQNELPACLQLHMFLSTLLFSTFSNKLLKAWLVRQLSLNFQI